MEVMTNKTNAFQRVVDCVLLYAHHSTMIDVTAKTHHVPLYLVIENLRFLCPVSYCSAEIYEILQ
ncbi:MAG: hypothetical protein HNEKOMLI_00022 [Sodalis sp. Psp]|nr:hypothetical protein [Sodalis sp. Psp]MCR3756529.1 hypothetical protein [Sodalis sp. Ppy]